jgi:hypothetical protein
LCSFGLSDIYSNQYNFNIWLHCWYANNPKVFNYQFIPYWSFWVAKFFNLHHTSVQKGSYFVSFRAEAILYSCILYVSHNWTAKSTISFAINWIDFNHDSVDMNHLCLWISLPSTILFPHNAHFYQAPNHFWHSHCFLLSTSLCTYLHQIQSAWNVLLLSLLITASQHSGADDTARRDCALQRREARIWSISRLINGAVAANAI